MMEKGRGQARNIDEYIAGFPEEVQIELQAIRRTIREAAPDAEETINYAIPTFKLNGNLVHFAAFKKHIGFYPAPSGIAKFKDELVRYEQAKGSVQFPLDQPVPYDLISRIVRFRVQENLEKAQAKTRKKKNGNRTAATNIDEYFTLRPVEPEGDFETLAGLFSSEQDEPTTKTSLLADYEQHCERIFCLNAADNREGELLGFNWAVRSRFDSREAYFYLIVRPEHRRKGVGSRLYDDAYRAALNEQIERLVINIRDNCSFCRKFAEQRGFTEKKHLMAMTLDLETFDDLPYDPILEKLRGEGFLFTSMQALGNTEEAQHKLFTLNNATALDVPGAEGKPSWLSFEDFQKTVCQADWYKPGGQMVVVDTSSNKYIALSAITRFEGADYAYNLHTGVDRQYRGRKLAQAVKVMALRYARDVLKVKTVHTHHNDKNQPMIAIDRKLGYVQIPGVITMVKELL